MDGQKIGLLNFRPAFCHFPPISFFCTLFNSLCPFDRALS